MASEDTDRIPFRRLRRIVGRHVLSWHPWKARVVFWAGAVAVGVIATVFAWMAEYANIAFHWVVGVSKWLPWIISPFGMVVALWLTQRFFVGSEGSGIPQTIAVLGFREGAARERLLSWRIVIGKVLVAGIGLLSGASIGREGPSVHVGAAIMYRVGKWAHFPRHDIERGLVLAGSAAGIAAAFNTPIAGIIFAIEEMSRSFEERTSGTVVIAVIVAGVTALTLQGNYTYFGTTKEIISVHDWPAIFVCGIGGGLVGGIFSSILVAGSRVLAPWLERFPYRVALACGLAIALFGLLSGQNTYGTGYVEAKAIVSGHSEAGLLYPLLKLLATVASYLSGIPGGIFAPSLAVGAGFGADVSLLFPTAPLAAIVVLGMVGYFTGVVQTPITGFVIVMEVTGSQEMALPIMATAFVAYGASRLVCPEPIYRALAERFLETPEDGTRSRAG
jgi:H+/Cl- antiporter ClcA